jgi:glycosyltransferase involved in cell wall biosynthesis
MRLAHFIQRYPPALGGSEAYFARLSRYLVQQGDDVTVFTSTALDLEAFWSRRGACGPAGITEPDSVSVRRYPVWRWPGRRYVLKTLSFFPHPLWQCLTQPCNPVCPEMWHDAGSGDFHIEAVHASAFPYAWPIACAWRLARRLRVPFLLTPFLHLGDPDNAADSTRRGYTASHLRWLLRQADGVFVQTPTERVAVIELGVAPKRVHLQGLGVDPAECTGGDREAARRSWGIAPGEVVVGHLANQSYEKGTIDLILAMEKLWAAGDPIRLVLAGPEMPNFTDFWKAFTHRVPTARQRVRRLGVLSETQKKDFYAGIDLFALPSRSDSFGLVLLEAWSNGVPSVAYRAGGIADVIRADVDGVLVPCGNLGALAGALGHLSKTAEQRSRLGSCGQERLATDFTWSDKLNLVRQVMTELIGKKDRTDLVMRTLPTS